MYENEIYHHGVKGMKWGHRKKYEYKYAYNQKPKNVYQKAMRSLGGTEFAKNAILKSRGLNESQKKKALQEHAILADEKAYNKAAKKAHKTGGKVSYDVTTGKYSVSKKEYKQGKKAAQKAYDKMAKQTMKDLQKQYGQLEDQMTYGKNADRKKNNEIQRELNRIENMMKKH